MKGGIHPQYYPQAQVVCACGNTFTVGSTKPAVRVEICAKCHPFFTGQQKFVDTLGRVERFYKRQQKALSLPQKSKKAKPSDVRRPMTLREMILDQSTT